MSEHDVEKNSLKVYVKMHDGTRILGNFYIGPDERLQDIMNDERRFLPLYALNEKSNKQHIVMVAKQFIEQVEEFVAGEATQPLQRTSHQAQSKPQAQAERRATLPEELSLDNSYFDKKRSTNT